MSNRRDDERGRWGDRDRSDRYYDDRRGGDGGGGPISNTWEATKETLERGKQKAEQEAERLKEKAKETAGFMKQEGQQAKELTKQKAETASAAAKRLLPPGMDERDACVDFHNLLSNCLLRSDCDLRRCRMEMQALHNCCKHGFENTSRYCYWFPSSDDDDTGDRGNKRSNRRNAFF